MSETRSIGNVLGAARAEADSRMLARAFVTTAAYRALTETQDYNFIVGRRGTGKSALFQKVKETFGHHEGTIVLADVPQEHHTIEFQRLLGVAGYDHRILRAISRVVWRTHVLMEVAQRVPVQYKVAAADYAFFQEYRRQHKPLLSVSGTERCVALLRAGFDGAAHPTEVPAKLSAKMQTDRLNAAIKAVLEATKLQVVVLYDGLDEGWEPGDHCHVCPWGTRTGDLEFR